MKRILAHHIIHLGIDHPLSVAEFDDDGRLVSITPFNGETHSTTFHNGTFVIASSDNDKLQITNDKNVL